MQNKMVVSRRLDISLTEESMMVETTVVTMAICVPMPSVKIIEKKRIDQSGEMGIFEIASGYATNARPAPYGQRKKSLPE